MLAATSVLLIAPIGVVAYYMAKGPKVREVKKDKDTDDSISRNTWVYLEHGIFAPKSIYGDLDQISREKPEGPVSHAMSVQENPTRALQILADHEAAKDRAVMSAYTEFLKPRSEIVVRSVNQPVTLVNILKPGTAVDKKVKGGIRFWDQPVPRSTGIDRYYKRDVTVPWYLTP